MWNVTRCEVCFVQYQSVVGSPPSTTAGTTPLKSTADYILCLCIEGMSAVGFHLGGSQMTPKHACRRRRQGWPIFQAPYTIIVLYSSYQGPIHYIFIIITRPRKTIALGFAGFNYSIHKGSRQPENRGGWGIVSKGKRRIRIFYLLWTWEVLTLIL